MTDGTHPILRVRNLLKTYPGGVEAVRGISFEAVAGQSLALLGPNGAGKTTTLKIIAGLARSDSGCVEVDGFGLESGRREYLRRIGMVSQHPNVDAELTADETMRVHARFFSMPSGAAEHSIDELLGMAGLSDRRKDMVSGYSGGMKRKLQIARALLHGPSLLVLDEPTVGLDPGSREKVWEFLSRLKDRGTAIVFSTHYMDEAEDRADCAMLVRGGLVIREGSPRELVDRLGIWCVETTASGVTERRYYHDKDEAATRLVFASGASIDASMRPTRLEDVYRHAISKELGQ